jgi:hypothetical protein
VFAQVADEAALEVLVDTACATPVAGRMWADDIEAYMQPCGLPCERVSKLEPFRFGPGARLVSKYALVLPVLWCNKQYVIRISIVEEEVPCLLSKRVLEAVGAVIDMGKHRITVGSAQESMPLRALASGHVAMKLLHPKEGEELPRWDTKHEAFTKVRSGCEIAAYQSSPNGAMSVDRLADKSRPKYKEHRSKHSDDTGAPLRFRSRGNLGFQRRSRLPESLLISPIGKSDVQDSPPCVPVLEGHYPRSYSDLPAGARIEGRIGQCAKQSSRSL